MTGAGTVSPQQVQEACAQVADREAESRQIDVDRYNAKDEPKNAYICVTEVSTAKRIAKSIRALIPPAAPPAPAGRETIAAIIAAVIQREGVTHSSVRKAADAILALGATLSPQCRGADQLCVVEADLALLQSAAREACDLLAERTQGSPARSAGHNARLRLERALGTMPARLFVPPANTGETGR